MDRVMARVLLIDPAGMCQITDLIANLIKAGSFVSKRWEAELHKDARCNVFCFSVTLRFRVLLLFQILFQSRS